MAGRKNKFTFSFFLTLVELVSTVYYLRVNYLQVKNIFIILDGQMEG